MPDNTTNRQTFRVKEGSFTRQEGGVFKTYSRKSEHGDLVDLSEQEWENLGALQQPRFHAVTGQFKPSVAVSPDEMNRAAGIGPVPMSAEQITAFLKPKWAEVSDQIGAINHTTDLRTLADAEQAGQKRPSVLAALENKAKELQDTESAQYIAGLRA